MRASEISTELHGQWRHRRAWRVALPAFRGSRGSVAKVSAARILTSLYDSTNSV